MFLRSFAPARVRRAPRVPVALAQERRRVARPVRSFAFHRSLTPSLAVVVECVSLTLRRSHDPSSSADDSLVVRPSQVVRPSVARLGVATWWACALTTSHDSSRVPPSIDAHRTRASRIARASTTTTGVRDASQRARDDTKYDFVTRNTPRSCPSVTRRKGKRSIDRSRIANRDTSERATPAIVARARRVDDGRSRRFECIKNESNHSSALQRRRRRRRSIDRSIPSCVDSYSSRRFPVASPTFQSHSRALEKSFAYAIECARARSRE